MSVVSWSWEGPENPYWIGTHVRGGITVGVIEYCDFPDESKPHWYFRMDPENTFGAATMMAVSMKLLELESDIQRVDMAMVSAFQQLMKTDEMKEFFGS